MQSIEQIIAQAHDITSLLVQWRRDFHKHPELGFQEIRTAGIVADHLRGLGLEVSTGIGKTGVVGILKGTDVTIEAPTVLLRFDMDALPIEETNDAAYRSQTPGVMHACGHDGHTAIGMAVAQLLAQNRDQLNGRVKLVFQPAEEGLGGAQAMIADGVMESPVPDVCFSMHLWTQHPLNQVTAQAGPLWASADTFKLEVAGRGGHGAAPHETIDATVVACEIVSAWQTIVSRTINPTDSAVVSVGVFHSGQAVNAISGHASVRGTIRTFSPEIQSLVQQRMRDIADGVCRAHGASFELGYPYNAPATINSEEGAAFMKEIAKAVVGVNKVTEITPMMVSEDMSEFLNRVPGCYILVGASDPEVKWHSPHHNSSFDFDERVLPTAAAVMASAALLYGQH